MEMNHATLNINGSTRFTGYGKGSDADQGRKRALSAGKLTFPFFGSSSSSSSQSRPDATTPKWPLWAKPSDNRAPLSPRSAASAMAAVLQQKKIRTRKGSLRKTALLGRNVDIEDQADLGFNPERTGKPAGSSPKLPSHLSTPETLTPEPITHLSSPPSSLPPPLLPDIQHHPAIPLPFSTTPTISLQAHPHPHRPLTSPSTTDDDDLLPTPVKPPPHEQSYFPSFPTGRRRPAPSPKSPLSSLPLSLPLPSPLPPHDYAETRAWGWVLLAATWIVFTVGMGSCLGVWSWAWDVGETPYAPPELEDDPTLPIVGYYPALIILTGVMAWVWVVVAWVGMKYFRHAKMGGEGEEEDI